MTAIGALLRGDGGPVGSAVRTWAALDDAGCETIYVREDLTLCAAIAARTRRARICCLTSSYDPARVVAPARRLSYLSEGRFLLGLGPLTDDDGPYAPIMAAERVAEEVLAQDDSPGVVVFGAGRGPFDFATELGFGWLTNAPAERFEQQRGELVKRCADLGRVDPLRCSVLAPQGEAVAAFAGADELVRPLDRPLAGPADAARWLEGSSTIEARQR